MGHINYMCIIKSVLYFTSKENIANGTKIRIQDKIVSEPYRYDRSQSVLIDDYYAYLPLYPDISYGDRVIVEGVVEDNKLRNAVLISLSESDNPLLAFRQKLLNVYQTSLPQDNAALVAGMTIGSKGLISQEFREKLKNTGTTHVVVASGMNVALVAGFLINLLIGLISRKRAIIFAFVGIWIYAILAGFDAPIIRAAIMASLTFGAQKIGRLSYAWRTLFITIFAMLMIKPEWIQDLGFLLSVSATASLMLFEAKVRKKVMFVPRLIREDLSTTLAAQVLVAPLLFVYFGQINLAAPFINAIILWTVPLTTTLGMLAGAAGVLFLPLGRALLYLLYPLTWWFIFVVELFGK